MTPADPPTLQPTDTDVGAAVRHLLDTGDLSGVPWILDTLQELGRDHDRRALVRYVVEVASRGQAEADVMQFMHRDGERPSPVRPPARRRPPERFVKRDLWKVFWLDLWTLESTLALAAWYQRSWPDAGERFRGVLDGSDDVLAQLPPADELTDPRD